MLLFGAQVAVFEAKIVVAALAAARGQHVVPATTPKAYLHVQERLGCDTLLLGISYRHYMY